MNDLANIRQLLFKASTSVARQKAIETENNKRGELFNVYRTCKVDYYETRHSNIIAEWLNPVGSHGQKDLFLSLFIQRTIPDFAQTFCAKDASVTTEYTTDVGRLDILIKDCNGKAIIIENKIYAADQGAQLKRYEKYAIDQYGKGCYRLLYLTIDGSDASDQSGKDVNYVPISYQRTIISWIEACISAIYDKPFLRESMIQYKHLIKQLTNQDMDKTIEKELVNEMMRSPEGVAAIIKAYPTWERCVLDESLFNPLKIYAEERGLDFRVSDSFWTKNAWGSFEFIIMPKLRIVFQYEKQGRYSFYYGIVDERPDRREQKPLPGLQGGNENWRYGWHYFDMHRNWTIDDIVEFTHDNGSFLKYICDAVDKMMDEMKRADIY
jgi:hypothetical protein